MIRKIISGGQTGVDRAALDAAIQLGIPHGGWCPRGLRAEDGRIPDRYELTETLSSGYEFRTRCNVDDSDGTLVINPGRALTGGTLLTWEYAAEVRKPRLLAVLANDLTAEAARVVAWIRAAGRPLTLNVAGPRESKSPGIESAARAFLVAVLLPFAMEV